MKWIVTSVDCNIVSYTEPYIATNSDNKKEGKECCLDRESNRYLHVRNLANHLAKVGKCTRAHSIYLLKETYYVSIIIMNYIKYSTPVEIYNHAAREFEL